MLRILPVIVALALVVGGGVVHALWTDRWGQPADAVSASEKLAAVPLMLGDWAGEPLQMDAKDRSLAEISGHLMRRYVHRRTGAEVTVYMVSGRGGPIAVHTPDVCLDSTGYHMMGARGKFVVPASAGVEAAEFWVAKFHKGDPGLADQLRVYWGWNASGSWKAPEDARLSLARYPLLYKLYVVRRGPRLDEAADKDPGAEFLKVLLPAAQKALGFTAAS